MNSRLADGSALPAYETGGSLHRGGERRVHHPEFAKDVRGELPDPRDEGTHISYTGRVHITRTNDAELLADLWGTIVDGEPVTLALSLRFQRFIADNLGEEAAESLIARTDSRRSGEEASSAGGNGRHYVYGHAGV